MKIRTVALIGAGSVGSYVIWGLYDKLGDDLLVIASGDRMDRLKREGICINGRSFAINVKTPAEARGADLLIIAVKYGALGNILDDIESVCDDHTIVMSLMNGIDTEDIIKERIGADRIMYSYIRIASGRKEGGFAFSPPEGINGIHFGETDPPYDTERVKAVAELFDNTPVCYHISDDIITEIWSKFAMNVGQNIPQAIIGCGIGGQYDSAHIASIKDMLLSELLEIAGLKGITIPEASMEFAAGRKAKHLRFSTLQDLDEGRHTEIDMLSGVIMKLGRELGIPVPYNTMVYHIVKAMEEKNDGMFDY